MDKGKPWLQEGSGVHKAAIAAIYWGRPKPQNFPLSRLYSALFLYCTQPPTIEPPNIINSWLTESIMADSYSTKWYWRGLEYYSIVAWWFPDGSSDYLNLEPQPIMGCNHRQSLARPQVHGSTVQMYYIYTTHYTLHLKHYRVQMYKF